MANQSYNGWKNYATWRVNLEFAEDLLSSMVGELAEKFESIEHLAECIEADCREFVEANITASNIIDGWVGAFLSDVDWYEIASAYEDELVEKPEDDE